ncbi:MAG: SDR family oxidoreductase [Eubacteriales bacterium]|nr:SDR family oxidoreductase [Eubacteriales bacterium]
MNILINGASRGIGAAMVRAFCERGDTVAFTYSSSESAARELSEESGALSIKADCRSDEEVKTAVKKANEFFCGSADVFINNAGIAKSSLFTDMSYSDFRDIFDVNVDGAFRFTQRILPDMIKKQKGRIIFITSMWGTVGASCEVAYSASKSALVGMAKSLAKELGPSGITVNCIAPGLIDTDMNAHLSPKDISELCDDTPLGRIGIPSEVAKAALFIASDSASFITGDVLNVSGGYIT